MEGLAVFGLLGFIFSMLAMSQIQRLERILRENGIRPAGAGALSGQLRAKVGQALLLTMSDGTTTPCRVLDADEEWILVLRNEGKKNQRELLLRLCDVKQVKPG